MNKLDIGCGGRGSRWSGFIGVDIIPPPVKTLEDREYIQLDFVNDQLPWDAHTFDEIVALHVIEHFDRPDGRTMIERAVGLLKPGCTLTITCPDLKHLCKAYLEKDAKVFCRRHSTPEQRIMWPGPTFADKLNWIIHEYGHKWAYDFESLMCIVREAGCRKVTIPSAESPYYTEGYHEHGLVITAQGDEYEHRHCSQNTQELERRLAIWDGRVKRGLKNR